jgi:hypothetical protein
MPYRAASQVLKTCCCGHMRAIHMAIRRHTVTIGREIKSQPNWFHIGMKLELLRKAVAMPVPSARCLP